MLSKPEVDAELLPGGIGLVGAVVVPHDVVEHRAHPAHKHGAVAMSLAQALGRGFTAARLAAVAGPSGR